MTHCSSRGTGNRSKGGFSSAPSLPAVARVVAGVAFVAPPVVAGEPGHELLRVPVVDLVKEGLGAWAPKDRRHSAVVADDDLVPSQGVVESVWAGHGRRLPAPYRCNEAVTAADATAGLQARRTLQGADLGGAMKAAWTTGRHVSMRTAIVMFSASGPAKNRRRLVRLLSRRGLGRVSLGSAWSPRRARRAGRGHRRQCVEVRRANAVAPTMPGIVGSSTDSLRRS